ncbi:uncharacterized protein LOC131942339 [Physella acuta]|uniref:uncharacterized protein LOC131942339 n=1 Tax=Physella acuta TaxID=109671 RepID=UPI0027DB6D08|nr:uncharacterized protein LOC131942339 [Physella acuta]
MYPNSAEASIHEFSSQDTVAHLTHLTGSAEVILDNGTTTWLFLRDSSGMKFVACSPKLLYTVWQVLKQLILSGNTSKVILVRSKVTDRPIFSNYVSDALSIWLVKKLDLHCQKSLSRRPMELCDRLHPSLPKNLRGSPAYMRQCLHSSRQEFLSLVLKQKKWPCPYLSIINGLGSKVTAVLLTLGSKVTAVQLPLHDEADRILVINGVEKQPEVTALTLQEEAELEQAVVDVQVAGQAEETKMMDVYDGPDHMTSCRGHWKNAWLFVMVMLLQVSGLKCQRCVDWIDIVRFRADIPGSYFGLTTYLSTYRLHYCRYGCCGSYKEECCPKPHMNVTGQPDVESDDEEDESDDEEEPDMNTNEQPDVESANEKPRENATEPCKCEESSDDGHKEADNYQDELLFGLVATAALLFFTLVNSLKKRKKHRSRH